MQHRCFNTKMALKLPESDWRRYLLCTMSQVHDSQKLTSALLYTIGDVCLGCPVTAIAWCMHHPGNSMMLQTRKCIGRGCPPMLEACFYTYALLPFYFVDIFICPETQNQVKIICSLLTHQAILGMLRLHSKACVRGCHNLH